MKTIGVISKFKFWLNHDLSAIPQELIKKIGKLIQLIPG